MAQYPAPNPAHEPAPYPAELTITQLLANAMGPNQRLAPSVVVMLRRRILRCCPQFLDPGLSGFVKTAFAHDELVEAYFYPRRVNASPFSGDLKRPEQLLKPDMAENILIPFEWLHQAGQMAQRLDVMKAGTPIERNMAYMATVLYPCGWLVNAHPVFKFCTMGAEQTYIQTGWMREELLKSALLCLDKDFQDMQLILKVIFGLKLEGEKQELQAAGLAREIALLGTAVAVGQMRWNGALTRK